MPDLVRKARSTTPTTIEFIKPSLVAMLFSLDISRLSSKEKSPVTEECFPILACDRFFELMNQVSKRA